MMSPGGTIGPSSWRYLWPALMVVLVVFPIGIRTNVDGWTAPEIDPPAPRMHLSDISSGFARGDARRPFAIFHSMVSAVVYMPYVYVRGGGLPPYHLDDLSRRVPTLPEELTVVSRVINLCAAVAVVVLAFRTFLLLTGQLWIAGFVALSVALNGNLAFHASVTYYENSALAWVFAAAFCFARLWAREERFAAWLGAFIVFAALAVSTHERMGGFFLFTIPLACWRVWCLNSVSPRRWRQTAAVVLVAFAAGGIAFALANNFFGAGVRPALDYIKYKSGAIHSGGRSAGLWSVLRNQIGAHGHAVRLVLWNLGGITPVLSAWGVWTLWRTRHWPGLVLLAFPLGYQVLSVGYVGWTAGRYILGQTLFVAVFAGFGMAGLAGWPGPLAGPGRQHVQWRWMAMAAVALIAQGVVLTAVKTADVYYHPRRVLQTVVRDAGEGERILIQGFDPVSRAWCERTLGRCSNVSDGQQVCDKANIVISTLGAERCRCTRLLREDVRKPPRWLTLLVQQGCYLYSDGPAPVTTQWCDVVR